MARVMVVEGNTPTVVAAKLAAGGGVPADQYAAALRHHAPGLETVIARPFHDEPMPTLDGLDGVALTGSGVDFSADDARAAPHLALVERIFAAGLPVIGSCWGLQTGTVVLGGAVGAAAAGIEAPIARALRLTPEGRAHPMHAGREAVFEAPCIHRDVVTRLPAGACVTATNDHCAVQAMVVETGAIRFWGVQYHPEHAVADMVRYFAMRPSPADDAGRGVLQGGPRPLGHRPMGAPDLVTLIAALEALEEGRTPAHALDPAPGPELIGPDRRGAELVAWLVAIGARDTPARSRLAAADAALPA